MLRVIPGTVMSHCRQRSDVYRVGYDTPFLHHPRDEHYWYSYILHAPPLLRYLGGPWSHVLLLLNWPGWHLYPKVFARGVCAPAQIHWPMVPPQSLATE